MKHSKFENLKKEAETKQSHVPGLNEDLSFARSIQLDKLRRSSYKTEIDLLEYRSEEEDPTKMLALPGTVAIYIGRKNSKYISGIKKAVEGSDKELEAEILQDIRERFINRELVAKSEAQDMMLNSRALFEFKCGTKTLLDGGFLPDGEEISYLEIPFCGTPYPQKPPFPDIELTEHVKDSFKPEIEAVAVYHQPELSEVEREALKKIPEGSREIIIGTAPSALGTSVWYASAVAAAAVAVMTATAGCANVSQLRELPIREDLLRNFSPEQSANQLLAVREQLMAGR